MTQGTAQNPNMPPLIDRPRRAWPPDGQFVDEIRIVTVPRLKESELSGDEWRISARIEFYRKGQLLGTRTWRDVETAARFLDWSMTHLREDGEVAKVNTDDLCDQEGCAEKAAVTYRLKKRYCRDGHPSEPFGTELRRFCERHKYRGDSALDDNDDNYEVVQ